jgi:hypothetical protein
MTNICVEQESFLNVVEVRNTNAFLYEIEINSMYLNSIPIHALINNNMHKGISRFSRS